MASRLTIEDIKINCSSFIAESAGIPLCKHLDGDARADYSRIKIRYKKTGYHILNDVVDIGNLYNRALFTQPAFDARPNPVYIFPTNGYRFVYGRGGVIDDYRSVIDSLLTQFGPSDSTVRLIKKIVSTRYTSDNLVEGLWNRSDIIIYNIPAFYIINAGSGSYDDVFKELT